RTPHQTGCDIAAQHIGAEGVVGVGKGWNKRCVHHHPRRVVIHVWRGDCQTGHHHDDAQPEHGAIVARIALSKLLHHAAPGSPPAEMRGSTIRYVMSVRRLNTTTMVDVTRKIPSKSW